MRTSQPAGGANPWSEAASINVDAAGRCARPLDGRATHAGNGVGDAWTGFANRRRGGPVERRDDPCKVKL